MVARLDPKQAKLYPEELPESNVILSSAAGSSVASYSAFNPYAMNIKRIMTGQTPGVTMRIDNDGGHAVIESPLIVRPSRQFYDVDVPSYDSLDIWMTGSAYNTFCTYVLRITKMTVFEKIRYGLSLTSEEAALDQEFEITKKFDAGLLRSFDVQQFEKIIEVSRSVTVPAGGNTGVGRVINVKSGQKAVILGISSDPGAVDTLNGGPGPNDTFVTLNRDKIDTAHIRLDVLSMPNLDIEIPCYIPAIDRHEIIVESLTGITSLPVRYRYGVSDLTLLEKIKWDRPITSVENTIIDELGLRDAIKAGVF
jgi:hypothetical protein